MPPVNPTLQPGLETDTGQVLFPVILDVNTNVHYDRNPLILKDVTAVRNQIYNLLTTTPGERVFEPLFGCNLKLRLFDPCDEITAWQMEIDVKESLGRWIPRVRVLAAPDGRPLVEAFPEERSFQVFIPYELVGVNINDVLSFSFLQGAG